MVAIINRFQEIPLDLPKTFGRPEIYDINTHEFFIILEPLDAFSLFSVYQRKAYELRHSVWVSSYFFQFTIAYFIVFKLKFVDFDILL